MRILLVEDQPDKREQIKDFISREVGADFNIVDSESLRGALRVILAEKSLDCIFLDMSMPNFDPSVGSPSDNSLESFAGKELLEQMKLRGIRIPVIVITQYSLFEGGTVTLEGLDKEFEREYGESYVGAVYFNSALDVWKKKLRDLLESIDGKES